MSVLHADSILKNYGSKQVLTDVYLYCLKGEIIGLLGRNGSGKSTLLKIIFGSIPADNRFVKVGDKIIDSLSDARGKISYLPQDSFLPNHIFVSKIVSIFYDSDKTNLIKNHKLIGSLFRKKLRNLSGGERRFLEIFLIIFSSSEFILLDEPFNGIAPIYKEEIKELIKGQSANKGFIITDHDYRNILDISTKTVLLLDGATKELDRNEDLIDLGYLPEV